MISPHPLLIFATAVPVSLEATVRLLSDNEWDVLGSMPVGISQNAQIANFLENLRVASYASPHENRSTEGSMGETGCFENAPPR